MVMNQMDYFHFENYYFAHKINKKMSQKLSFIGLCDSCHFNFFF